MKAGTTADYADVTDENRDLKPRMNQPSQSYGATDTNEHQFLVNGFCLRNSCELGSVGG
jgi:hypothetical protein